LLQTRIVLATSRRLVGEGFRTILDNQDDMKVIGEAGDGLEAFRITRQRRPDLLLFEVELPKFDGLKLVRELTGSSRGVRYLALTVDGEEDSVGQLCECGIHGYVPFTAGIGDLLQAIRAVSAGGSWFDGRVTGDLPASLHYVASEKELLGELTPREKEVVYWLSQGFNNQQIAREMVLSEKTVKNHVSHVLRKLELKDRTQVAILAWKTGMARLSPEAVRLD